MYWAGKEQEVGNYLTSWIFITHLTPVCTESLHTKYKSRLLLDTYNRCYHCVSTCIFPSVEQYMTMHIMGTSPGEPQSDVVSVW